MIIATDIAFAVDSIPAALAASGAVVLPGRIPSSGDCETRGRRAACDLSGDWPLCVVDLCRYAGVESKIQNVCLLLCHAIADGDHRFRVAVFTSPVTPTSRSPTDGVG